MKGATAYEYQIGRFCIRFLRFKFWFWPRKHFATKKWQFPRYISWKLY